MRLALAAVTILMTSPVVMADGPRDNIPGDVRPIPPPGIEVSDRQLQDDLAELGARIERLRLRRDARTPMLLPDVEIFHRAVHDALTYGEFFAPNDVQNAKELLRVGLERAEQLALGQSPWTTQTGLVVRGFVSKLDRTVQPYGLVIPDTYTFHGRDRFRLDLWLHGRGETLSENNFIAGRMKQVGNIAPADTIVLHPYGRYSNAFKFAGEVDVLEALDHARKNYLVDDDRVAVRGFSMGGAGAWQLAVHYPGRFFAANPGAGFSETPEFLKSFQQETLQPTWFEERLWRWYDCPGYAANLYNLPTVAYSGELDIQQQAADVMEAALARENITLVHVIGPQTMHSIHPDSLREIEERLASLAEQGRTRIPPRVQLSTFTLKYPRSHWIEITGLQKHWEPTRVEAAIVGPSRISVSTKNVTGLTLSMPSGWCPFSLTQSVEVEVDGKRYETPRPGSDRSWSFHLWNGEPQDQSGPPRDQLHKRHNLQGPIDDAFMDSFIVVRPTGKAAHELVEQWTQGELRHFVEHWRRHFRGNAIVKDDTEITDSHIAASNLILFGDPSSNEVLRRISADLPIQWTESAIGVGNASFAAEHHAPVLLYPNPLNPSRYIVVNSGFTFREFAYLNNARQVPKLPDWAIVDLRTPPDSLWPGKIVAADFFDEQWRLAP